MTIDSKTKLAEYCLRTLGAPVINIEIDEDQIEDRINDAIDLFLLRHYDGSDVFGMVIPILVKDYENGYISLPPSINSVSEILSLSNKSNVEKMDDIDYNVYAELHQNPVAFGSMTYYWITQDWLNTVKSMFSVQHNFDFNATSGRFTHHEKLPLVQAYKTLEDITLSNCVYTENDATWKDGELTANTVTITSDGAFSINTKYITTWYPKGLYTVSFNLRSNLITDPITVTIKDRLGQTINYETISPTLLWEKHYIETDFISDNGNDIVIEITGTGLETQTIEISDIGLFKNNFIVLSGYKNLEADDVDGIWNNRWLKKYTTALIKKNWGSNLKKYDGVVMVGGTSLNGQIIFDEATSDIEKLEEELQLECEEPLGIYTG